MTTTPTLAPSRRQVLRTAAAGVAVAAAPVLPGLATAATASATTAPATTTTAAGAAGQAARAKAGKKSKKLVCRKVKVKGSSRKRLVCKPKKKKGPVVTDPGTPTKPVKGTKPATPGTPATPTPAPVPLPPGGLLSPGERHLVSRFSYGVDRPTADRVLAAGGAAAWFEQQLTTPGTSDPATDEVMGWWPSLGRSAQDLWKRNQGEVEFGWDVMADYQRMLLLRRLRTTRPVLDVMAEFWENHFNVPVQGDGVFTHRVSYGTALRERALGTFEDLLKTSITHPAMLIYLNGAVSTKARPNENLGRELLELHTVGRGHYTEDDVKSSARILTGYRVAMWTTWAATYQTGDHWTGPVQVMDFSHANADADGRAVVDAYLRYLAHHPATAQRVARKLALKFVSDTPSDALVQHLAGIYLASGTSIVPVLRALVASAEFQSSANQKVRDPAEDIVATYRVLGVQVARPTDRGNDSAEMAILWQAGALGLTPHAWPRPDGAPADNQSWSSTSRLLASLEVHYAMSGGWWPKTGVGYRTPADWLPAASVTFSDLVEHLSRELLHTTTPAEVLQAACQATAARPDEVITASHPVVRWKMPRLLTTLLDSPLHLKR